MLFAVLILIAILLLLGGGGVFLHWLWIAAIIALVIWVLGFFMRTATGGGRWYRW